MFRSPFAVLIVVSPLLLISGCEVGRVKTELRSRPDTTLPISIRVYPCVDRTDTEVTDLAAQATRSFEEGLNTASEFIVTTEGKYSLSCEISSFLPGNAVKRWVLPGWGATVGQVSAMIQKSETGEILIIVEGNATVGSGGLYTIGAWEYIVPTAVKDSVRQLQVWARAAK